jgi:hypothetical protein
MRNIPYAMKAPYTQQARAHDKQQRQERIDARYAMADAPHFLKVGVEHANPREGESRAGDEGALHHVAQSGVIHFDAIQNLVKKYVRIG